MNISNYSVFDDMIEGVQVLDSEWRYFYVNDVVTEQGKMHRDEMIGNCIFDLYTSILGSDLERKMRLCMEERIPQRFLNEFLFPDGTTGFFELRIHPVKRGILIMSVDVTEQVLAQRELKRVNENLERLVEERTRKLAEALEREQKLSELRARFISFASHEFKTPLFVIDMSCRMLEKLNFPPKEEERQAQHEIIRNSISDLFQFMDNLIIMEKLEQNKIDVRALPFDFEVLIKDEIRRLHHLGSEGQEIVFSHEHENMLTMDRESLRVVITNLLSNAIKYSQDRVTIKSKLENGYLIVDIIDNGIGIPASEHANLFGKFFRGSNALENEGTGLGLYIVSKYMELLNGTIDLESEQNVGTKAHVVIPMGIIQDQGQPASKENLAR